MNLARATRLGIKSNLNTRKQRQIGLNQCTTALLVHSVPELRPQPIIRFEELPGKRE